MDASNDTLGGLSGDGVNSMAIALLCEKGDAALDETAVSEGSPKCLDQAESTDTKEVTINSLTVGDKTYTENVVGKWNSDEFQNGELKNSDETGVYTGTVTLDALGNGQKAVLTLSDVYTAASIKVNGTEVGNLLYAPWTLDITDAVKEGENTIEISVTPRKYNAIHTDAATEELVDTGFAGTAVVEIQ